jgi:hypothetical protein
MTRPGGSTEALDLDADSFFAVYEQELAGVDVEANAKVALDGILSIQNEDGQARTYQQIRSEAEAFFANPIIAADMQLLDSLASQYANFCLSHAHGGFEGLDGGLLESIFERGMSQLRDDHDHSGRSEKKGRSKKEAKVRRVGLWTLLLNYGRKDD